MGGIFCRLILQFCHSGMGTVVHEVVDELECILCKINHTRIEN